MGVYARALVNLDFFNCEKKNDPIQKRCDQRNKLFRKNFKKICSTILEEKIIDEEDKAMLHTVHGISDCMHHIGNIEEIFGIKAIIYDEPLKMFQDILKTRKRNSWIETIDNPVKKLLGFLVMDFSKDKDTKKYFAISIKTAKKYSPLFDNVFYRALLAQALSNNKLDLDKIKPMDC